MHFFLILAWTGNFSWLQAFIGVPRGDLGGILDSKLPIVGLFFPSSVARLQGSFSWVLCNPWIYSALRGEGTLQSAALNFEANGLVGLCPPSLIRVWALLFLLGFCSVILAGCPGVNFMLSFYQSLHSLFLSLSRRSCTLVKPLAF